MAARHSSSRARVGIIGAGPAGMAAALSLDQAGFDVALYERGAEARPAGNILNLWPPPIKALALMGVDIDDLGSPCVTEFRSVSGNVRARVDLPKDAITGYGGGFIGLLRPQLYRRLLDVMPDDALHFNHNVGQIHDHGDGVTIEFDDGSSSEVDLLVGADGINSSVRRHLFGDINPREHNLHIFGGFTFAEAIDGAEDGMCVISHNRHTQGSWTSILHEGRRGFQWWVLTAHDSDTEFVGDLHAESIRLGADFPAPLSDLIAATDPEVVQRWVLRDIPELDQWTKGRVVLIGDAAHATSPYAAYGAGMATEDGYFLGRALAGVDLTDTDAVATTLAAFAARKPITTAQVELAYRLGKAFHHLPRPLRTLRDLVFDRTSMLQKQIGEASPGEIMGQLALIDEAEAAFRTVPGVETVPGVNAAPEVRPAG